MIEVKFLTRFIDITGEKSIQVADIKNIEELMDHLCNRYDDKFKEVLLDDQGEIRDFLKVMVNSEDIRDIDGLKTPLKDGDQVVMFQTIAGG